MHLAQLLITWFGSNNKLDSSKLPVIWKLIFFSERTGNFVNFVPVATELWFVFNVVFKF